MFELRAAKIARVLLFGLELITVAILTALAVFAIIALMLEIPDVVAPPFLGADAIGRVLDHILAVFVLIELLATAVAYMRGVDVVRRIFEAMLVALARKLIGLELTAASLDKAGALAMLLVAAGLAWWLVRARRDRGPGQAERSSTPQT